MPSRSLPNHFRRTAAGLLLAGLLAFAQWKGWLPKNQSGGQHGESSPPPDSPAAGSAGSDASSAPRAGETTRQLGEWQELGGCTLAEDRGNDGDSFEVLHHGTRHTVRLYFADCPEKYRHQYNGPRLADQGRYFGGLSEEETVHAGETARDFTLARLRAAPFTILTKWEKVFDSGRVFAFVTVGEGDLAELLVREGLARIYTDGANRPGGPSVREEKEKLYRLERAARKARRGAWGGLRAGKN